MGIKVTCILSNMEYPIGHKIGNSLEILETLECLRGEGPTATRELVEIEGKWLFTSELRYWRKSFSASVRSLRNELPEQIKLASNQELLSKGTQIVDSFKLGYNQVELLFISY